MIGRIQGTLISITAPKLLIDCNGVGYEVDVPMSTLYQLPLVGQQLTLLTHFHVREDLQQLFGFATNAERDAFRSLIKISGVGARTALAVLSGTLTRVPGIGKKTAERLLLELKGKLAPDLGLGQNKSSKPDIVSEITQALLALGYSDKEAHLAVRQVPADITVSDGIKLALKSLSKG
jgi:Holliday junction DNA helicase RuvA